MSWIGRNSETRNRNHRLLQPADQWVSLRKANGGSMAAPFLLTKDEEELVALHLEGLAADLIPMATATTVTGSADRLVHLARMVSMEVAIIEARIHIHLTETSCRTTRLTVRHMISTESLLHSATTTGILGDLQESMNCQLALPFRRMTIIGMPRQMCHPTGTMAVVLLRDLECQEMVLSVEVP